MLSYPLMLNKKNIITRPPLHGISSDNSISFTSDKRVYKTIPFSNMGSATIEAAIIIPLFLFAAFSIFTLCNILQTKEIIYEGIQETAQYLAEYQYEYITLEEALSGSSQSGFAGTNTVTAKLKLEGYIDDEEIVDKYVSGGMDGLIFKEAYFNSDDGYIYLNLQYDLKVNIPIIGNITWQETEQVQQKAYVGLVSGDTNIDDEDIYVYITETGEVYHRSRQCYHISLTIIKVSENSLNTTYSGYEACELCAQGRDSSGNIYITETGNKYHYSIGCSGLKRTVMRVKLSDVTGMPACSECGY